MHTNKSYQLHCTKLYASYCDRLFLEKIKIKIKHLSNIYKRRILAGVRQNGFVSYLFILIFRSLGVIIVNNYCTSSFVRLV